MPKITESDADELIDGIFYPLVLQRCQYNWEYLFYGGFFLTLPAMAIGAWVQGFRTADSIGSWLPVVVYAIVVPLGIFLRNQRYKAHWQINAVSPDGYASGWFRQYFLLSIPVPGTLALSFLTGGLTLTAGTVWLLWVVTALFCYPNGKPMRPTSPRLGARVE